MGWFQILKATPVFNYGKQYTDLGYYESGEGKINLANFGRYKDSSDEEVIDAVMNIAIHEDTHAAFHEGKEFSKVLFDLLLMPLGELMDSFKTNPERLKEVLYKINYDTKVLEDMRKFVQHIMIDEVFAYRSGHLRMDEKFENYFIQATKGKHSKELTRLAITELASEKAKEYMEKYVPKYIRDFSNYLDRIFKKNANQPWVNSYTKDELDKIRDTLMKLFEEVIKREISKLR